MASGLLVNFDKCCAFGVNLGRDEVSRSMEGTGCLIGEPHILYLGLKVGDRFRSTDGWEDVIQKVNGRIGKWDNNSMSMGGRITVINSILMAMPIY